MKGNGNCYQSAGTLIADMPDDALLCHGTVTGQGPVEGIKFGHAWIEINDIVIDKSNGNNICMDKERYYSIGKIKNVRRYSKSTALKNLLKYETFGPWK